MAGLIVEKILHHNQRQPNQAGLTCHLCLYGRKDSHIIDLVLIDQTLLCPTRSRSDDCYFVVRHLIHLTHLSERDAIQSACKKGAEVVDCPDQATCGGGSILACDFPLEKKMDGSACVLTAEAKEEVNAVVEALR